MQIEEDDGRVCLSGNDGREHRSDHQGCVCNDGQERPGSQAGNGVDCPEAKQALVSFGRKAREEERNRSQYVDILPALAGGEDVNAPATGEGWIQLLSRR